jgi:endo-1,4-beta-xylanase
MFLVCSHNFVWGASNPNWLLDGNFSPSQLVTIMQNHINTVADRYAGRAYCWDVVNEAVSDDDSNSSQILKASPPWYPAIPNYIDIAFQTARAADPHAKLFYNDYGAEGAGVKSDKVRCYLPLPCTPPLRSRHVYV